MSATEQLAPGAMIGDRYRVVRFLGSGGMSEVYVAEHLRLARKVAVKRLRPWMLTSLEAVARFVREARTASRISHDNVIGVLDFGVSQDGAHFLVMELVEGRSLDDVVDQAPLSFPRALHVLAQITSALGAAHRLGIVHRDVKPGNVMLTRRGSDNDFVKVLDFGLARPIGGDEELSKVTRPGEVLGSPHYMAPETWGDRGPDVRSDLYALGVSAWELVNGATPFRGSSVLQLLASHAQEVPPPASQGPARPSVPPAFDELVRHLLEKDASRRPASTDEVLAALTKLVPDTSRATRNTTYGHLVPRPTPSDSGSLPDPTVFQASQLDTPGDGPTLAVEIAHLHALRRRRIAELADALWGAEAPASVREVRASIGELEARIDGVGREVAVLDERRREHGASARAHRAELRGALLDASLAREALLARLPPSTPSPDVARPSQVEALLVRAEGQLAEFEDAQVETHRELDHELDRLLNVLVTAERELAPQHDALWAEVSRASRSRRELRPAMVAVGRIDGAINAYQGLLEVLAARGR